MRNRCLSVFRSVRSAAILSACLWVTVMFSGCGDHKTEMPEETPFCPVVVYDDGVYAVMCTDMVSDDSGVGSEQVSVKLHVTNSSTNSIALSSVHGIRVTAENAPCQILSLSEDKAPVDGLIDAGCSREGWITAEMPVEAKDFTVEMAVDYLNDDWISFSISR